MDSEFFSVIAIFCVIVAVLGAKKERPLEMLPEPTAEVVELAKGGKRVAAVKKYRDDFDVTLLEAGKVVDSLIKSK